MSDPVTYALEETTAVIRMDDGKANALSYEMLDGLIAALDRAEGEAQAIVLAGRPDRFCAGFDLRVMMSGPDHATKLLLKGSDVFLRLYSSPLPVIIACTGHAMAGGALVVLTGDIRIGAQGAYRIGLNEVTIGLPIPILGIELARDRLTAAELSKATLMATIYNPDGAVRAGYLDEAVAPTELMPRAIAEAKRLGALARGAFKGTKQRLRERSIEYMRTSMARDMATLLGK